MKTLALTLLTLFSASAFAGAEIRANDYRTGPVTVALDAKGVPRFDQKAKTYPTIKDFDEGSDYAPFCYVGTMKEARALMMGLVEAANGDGDSWAEWVSMKSIGSKVIEVRARITSEAGEYLNVYTFNPCL